VHRKKSVIANAVYKVYRVYIVYKVEIRAVGSSAWF